MNHPLRKSAPAETVYTGGLVDQLRMAWLGMAVPPLGPRAAGRVASWSLTRCCGVLRRQAAAPIRFAAPGTGEPVPHERSFLAVLAALDEGNRELARAHARWLVRPGGVDPLLRAAKSLSDTRLAGFC
jgi:hypothetical protein